MTTTSKSTLKTYFNTEDVPTEAHFHALIDSLGQSFCPIDYGAVGDGATDDSVAVQAAIDDASVAGGIVNLAGYDYRVTLQGSRTDIGQYDADYALWLNADNVFIVGPGTIRITEEQASTRFNLLLIGNGGTTDGTAPGESGTWIENVGMIGVRFDATGLTKANRDAMDTALLAGMVTLAYVRYYAIQNCTFLEGWGNTICPQSSSRYGYITGNTLKASSVGSRNDGIDADGGRYHIVSNNVIELHRIAINLQSNLDNGTSGYALYNQIIGNQIVSCTSAINLIGSAYNSVTGNYIYNNSNSTAAVKLNSYATSQGSQESSYNRISGNYFYKAATGGTAFQLVGYDTHPVTGAALVCQENVIADNYIDGHYETLVDIGEQSSNNWFRDNIWDTPGTFTADDATPSVTGFDIWKTANANATTITMLDNGYVGQRVTVIVADAVTTIDFSGTHLKGNGGADWSPGSGDYMTCVFDGTDWYCSVVDTTA